MCVEVRQLGASDAEGFSALRRLVTADNPVPMGLTLEEELARPLQGFRDQLSAPAPSAAFGVFIDGRLRACAALAWQRAFELTQHGNGIKPVTTPTMSPRIRPMPAPSSVFTTTSVQWHAADLAGGCAGVASFGLTVRLGVVLMDSPWGER